MDMIAAKIKRMSSSTLIGATSPCPVYCPRHTASTRIVVHRLRAQAKRPDAFHAPDHRHTLAIQRGRNTTVCSAASAQADSRSGKIRLIQHKEEAFWFYRFLSIFYDTIVNPGHWTEDMRTDALTVAELNDENLKVRPALGVQYYMSMAWKSCWSRSALPLFASSDSQWCVPQVCDVGGGTGFCTLGVVETVKPENVTLVDQSPHQLSKAKAKPALQRVTIKEVCFGVLQLQILIGASLLEESDHWSPNQT